MLTSKLRLFSVCFGVTVAAIFGIFVWPTPYEQIPVGEKLFRVSRFSGDLMEATDIGWLPITKIVDRKAEITAELAKQVTLAQNGKVKAFGDTKVDVQSAYFEGSAIYHVELTNLTDELKTAQVSGHLSLGLFLETSDKFQIAKAAIGSADFVTFNSEGPGGPYRVYGEVKLAMSPESYRAIKGCLVNPLF